MVIIFKKNHKKPSSSLTVEGGLSICDTSCKEGGSDLHMEVGIGGIVCVSAEGPVTESLYLEVESSLHF